MMMWLQQQASIISQMLHVMAVYCRVYICDGGVRLKPSLLILIIAEKLQNYPDSQGLIIRVCQPLPLRYYIIVQHEAS